MKLTGVQIKELLQIIDKTNVLIITNKIEIDYLTKDENKKVTMLALPRAKILH